MYVYCTTLHIKISGYSSSGSAEDESAPEGGWKKRRPRHTFSQRHNDFGSVSTLSVQHREQPTHWQVRVPGYGFMSTSVSSRSVEGPNHPFITAYPQHLTAD